MPTIRARFAVAAVAAVIAGLSAPVARATPNLVQNGGFETGDLTDWTASGSDFASVKSDQYAHSGNDALQFDAYVNNPAIISQNIGTIIGGTYTFTFWARTVGGIANSLTASFGSNSFAAITNEANLPYTEFSYDVVATSTVTKVAFAGADNPLWVYLDDVSVTAAAVPEPAAGATLLALGAGAWWLRRRPRA